MRFFATILRHFASDWQTSRLAFCLETLGTGTSIVAAILMASQTAAAPLAAIFGCWLLGSVAFLVSSYLRQHGWMMVMMLFYTTMNIWGLSNLVLR